MHCDFVRRRAALRPDQMPRIVVRHNGHTQPCRQMLIDVQSADCRADAHQKVVAAAAVALGVTATMNAKLFTFIGAEVDPNYAA